MVHSISRIVAAASSLRRLRRAVSLRDAIRIHYAAENRDLVEVYLKAIGRNVCIRNGTTDRDCLEKIFVHDEYNLPFDLKPQLIVDAGANIGMATLYFAHRYPEAQVVAIEPALSNFEMLQRNCKGLPNITLIQGALWHTNSALEIEDPTVAAWAFRVIERPTQSVGADVVTTITIPRLLAQVGAKRIGLLKIDIEGAELQLFSNGADKWIDLVKVIVIELHDRFRPGCAQAFYSVLTSRQFVQEIKGENIFVKVLNS